MRRWALIALLAVLAALLFCVFYFMPRV
jgi:hypothetical protein